MAIGDPNWYSRGSGDSPGFYGNEDQVASLDGGGDSFANSGGGAIGTPSVADSAASISSAGTAGLAAQGAGDLLSGLGGLYAGGMEAAALRMQANLQLQNGQLDLLAGNANAAKSQIMSGQKIGALQGAAAASGVTESGSVLSVMAASSMNSEMDRQNILHGAQVRDIQAENQASMDSAGAQSAQTGSYFKAIGGGIQTGLIAAAVL